MDRIRMSLVFTALISAAMASVAPPAASVGAASGVPVVQTGFQPRVPERQVQTLLTRIRTDAESLRRLVDARGSYRQTLEPEMVYVLDDLVQATTHLTDHIARRQTVRADVEDVLRRGAVLDASMGRSQPTAQASTIWTRMQRDLDSLAGAYNVTWDWRNPRYSDPAGDPVFYRQVTGTYQLDPARSDDPQRIADAALNRVTAADRTRVSRRIGNRLDPPEAIAIERAGNRFTIISSKAPQAIVEADGRTRTEQGPAGRTITTRAATFGDALEVTTTGAAGNSFSVTFEPLDSGRSLQVTRRLFDDALAQPVVISSVYRRTAETADWSLFDQFRESAGGRGRYPSEYLVPAGTTLVATLDQPINASAVRQDDRISLTVRTAPTANLEGAVIEGYVTSAPARSGNRVSLSVDFDQIRLRNGRTSPFVGDIQRLVDPNGREIKFTSERVEPSSGRTTDKAIQRGAIGAAIGALIGALAGGGDGAALGALIGAGGGAATVLLDNSTSTLPRGTEFTIRAATPASR
jgi:hypothetical protein